MNVSGQMSDDFSWLTRMERMLLSEQALLATAIGSIAQNAAADAGNCGARPECLCECRGVSSRRQPMSRHMVFGLEPSSGKAFI